jgi:hypothetical protein
VQSGNCVCPGVFTTTQNGNPALFFFPTPPFDFSGITIDLAQMKSVAGTSGNYLPPSTTTDALAKGYHIKFKNNGTFEAWIITDLSWTYAYNLIEDWHYDYFTITDEYLFNTYPISSDCSVIFVEDDIWLEGEVAGKVTLASADLLDSSKDTNVVLVNDVTAVQDGVDSMALIGENDVLIGPQSPDQMELDGIYIAQKGLFGRNHYPSNIKTLLQIHGSIVSSGRVGTQWVSGSTIVSGYRQRETYFDTNLIYSSPPFVPYVEPDFKIIDWDEMK